MFGKILGPLLLSAHCLSALTTLAEAGLLGVNDPTTTTRAAQEEKLYYNKFNAPTPLFRYRLWSTLTSQEQIDASINFGYTMQTWEIDPYAKIERTSFLDLEPLQIAAAKAMGYIEDMWDVFINHFDNYDWADLEEFSIDEPLIVLGWDEIAWNGPVEGWPASENVSWDNLTDAEKQAAADLGYFKETWDNLNLADFVGTSLFLNPPPAVTDNPSSAPSESYAPSSSSAPSESYAPSSSSVPSESYAPSSSSAPSESYAPSSSSVPSESPSESYAPSLSPSESYAPSFSSVPSESYAPSSPPSESADDDGPTFSLCFPGSARVTIEGKGLVSMDQVELGDRVLVGNTKEGPGLYEPIYSFGHYDRERHHSYLQISTAHSSAASKDHKNKRATLEITQDHMIVTNGKGIIPASLIEIGDELLDAKGDRMVAQKISSVSRQGSYAPFTSSGQLIVDGILVSSYVAFQDSGFLTIGGVETPFSFQWLDHSFTFPLRFYCKFWSTCTTGTYTSHGVSSWLEIPRRMTLWIFEQNAIVMALVMSIVVLLGSLLAILEAAPVLVVAAVILGGATHYYCLKGRDSMAFKKMKQL